MEFSIELPGNFSFRNLMDDAVVDRLLSVFALSEKLTLVLGCLQIVLGTLFNLFLLVVVLGKKELRCNVRNMLIASLTIADLIFVGVLQPVQVSSKIWEGEPKNKIRLCHVDIVLQLLHMFAFNFVSAWGLVCLDSLLLARLGRLDMPLTSFLTSAFTTSVSVWKRRLDRAVVVAVIALPWAMSVIVITPIVFTGLHEFHQVVWTVSNCPFIFVRWALLALNVLFFILPCLLAFVLLSISACLFCYRRRRGGIGMVTTSTTAIARVGEGEATSPPDGFQDRLSAYLTGNVVTFALTGPSHLVSMLNQYLGPVMLADMPQWLMLKSSVVWVSETKSVLLPLVWLLLLPDLRAHAWHLLTLGKRVIFGVKDPPSSFDPTVSYRNLDP